MTELIEYDYAVKYNNQMNKIPLKKFNGIELDMFMALCSIAKEKGQEEIELTFDYIKEITNYKGKDEKQFFDNLVSMNEKLLGCKFRFKDEGKLIQFVFFPTFETDEIQKTLTVGVNKKFSFLLNNLACNFTRLVLNEFTALRSSYSKEAYRRLMQYKDTGLWHVKMEEFKLLLDIPKSYKMSDINKVVLNRIENELTSLFEDFKIEKIKGKYGKVTSIKFTFKPLPTVEKYVPADEQLDGQIYITDNKGTKKTFKKNKLSQDSQGKIDDSVFEKIGKINNFD